MRSFVLPVALVALTGLLAGCAQETDDDEVGDDAADALTNDRFQRLSVDLPVTKDAEEVFASEAELRDYFGTSCGWFCTTPYAGRLPFTIGRGEYVVLISRAESAPRQGFSVAGVSRSGNPKWVDVATCPNASGKPYALAKIATSQLTIWASDKGNSGSCR